MMSTAQAPLPAAPCLRIPEGEAPYLEAQSCGACDALYLTPRMACSRCGKRDDLHPQRLADRGTLYSFAIVHRSFPGVETPFISAIVDLEGGGTLKGNLRGIEATPEAVRLGMAVKVVIDDALGRRDKDGNAYLAYFFEPAEEPSA
jgi:uncharacterized OB-fold protein